MSDLNKLSLLDRLKLLFIGEARNIKDRSVFHGLSLAAFFAWVGLGADGLSSSCYGPPEAFITLGSYHYLGLFVALGTAITIFIIAESYSQIIELFPHGGGGYLVASNLLSPFMGMFSGCALMIDYVLTITVSIASGADAVFSFLPVEWQIYKLWFAVVILLLLIWLNLRGVKESVVPLVPIFLIFVATHALIIVLALATHFLNIPQVVTSTASDFGRASSELGLVGALLLIMKGYSMGAGTYTGIEAVSNGLPILKEPRVKTAKRTMTYMVISLATVVLGLMFAYVFYRVEPVAGKTINAVLFDKVCGGWGYFGYLFVLIALVSEGAILFVAAQAGFLDGPRVLSNMALDRWMPKRFAILSDRLVTFNGILIMGGGAVALMLLSRGAVSFLIVLYSINVFITFLLSQTGMVKHWWLERKKVRGWWRKLFVNGIGMILTAFILIMVTTIKFNEGGWITLFITLGLVSIALYIRRSYESGDRVEQKLDDLVQKSSVPGLMPMNPSYTGGEIEYQPNQKTAIFIVKDFNGVGIKSIINVMNSFGGVFKNFVFVQCGLLNAGIFKETEEINRVREKVVRELDKYKELLNRHGYFAKCYAITGIDVVEELDEEIRQILLHFPGAEVFGGQTVFPNDTWLSRLLHNYTLFSIQRRLYNRGVPVYLIPIRV